MNLKIIFFSAFLPLSCFLNFTIEAKTLERAEHSEIIKKLKLSSSSENLIHIITDTKFEVPDPSEPLLIDMPNGQKKYVLGFSGQSIMMVDKLSDLTHGGIKKVYDVKLTNPHGFPYGGEIDPNTRKALGYAFDSSTWDLAIFRIVTSNGKVKLKVVAGAMGTGADGKPLMSKDGHNNTRQRLFFDAEFRPSSSRSGDFELHAFNPKSVLNSGVPVDGNWIQKDASGKIIFSHGYGGEPVRLLNGDLFIDERGRVPFVHELVVEQREIPDSNAPGGVRKIPYRTALVLTYLDRTLSHVITPAKIIFDVYKNGTTVWKAAQRPTAGPLIEGAHIEVRHQGSPVENAGKLIQLRKQGAKLDYQLLFSAGEYFGNYGSYMAVSRGNLETFKPLLNDEGELLDLTAPLRVLFTWIGRPVSFHVNGQEYLMIHGVDRNSLPVGILLDQVPRINEWQYFRRQEIVIPIERFDKNGIEGMRIKDDAGLIKFLKQFTPRKVSKINLVSESSYA